MKRNKNRINIPIRSGHVNHMKEFLKSVHNDVLFSQLFARASTSWHIVTGTLKSKLFDLISSFWHDLPKNHWVGWICDNRGASSKYVCFFFGCIQYFFFLICRYRYHKCIWYLLYILLNGNWHSSLDRSPPRQLSPQI